MTSGPTTDRPHPGDPANVAIHDTSLPCRDDSGQTNSLDLPVTPDAFCDLLADEGSAYHDGFLIILSGDGRALEYGTYVGGTGYDVFNELALGPAGHICSTHL